MDNYQPTTKSLEATRQRIKEERESIVKEHHTIKGFANRHGYSDVHPLEVVEIKTPNKVMVKHMSTKQIKNPTVLGLGGFVAIHDNNSQEWECFPNPTEHSFAIRWSKSKEQWQDKYGSRYVMNNFPIKHYDYNF